jgi:two-component system sensor histidine kinase SenX3
VEELVDLHAVDVATAGPAQPVPVHLVVAEAVERARPLARSGDVVLAVTEAPRRLTVLGDRRQLATAVAHLVENAVRHSPAEGVVQVFAATDGRMVDVVVRDTGVGLSPREQERIFEPFYRGDGGAGRGATGAERPGLGLTIARQVAERHGGDVAVHSREGAGSTFTLRLPIAPGSVVVTAAEAG